MQFFRGLMNSYLSTQKSKYRITLELDVMQDFNPHQIDWNKLFDLEPNEKVESYVEDLSVRW
jgi:hypothetical protein